MQLSQVLSTPLTMAKFVNQEDLTEKALHERFVASMALSQIETSIADIESQVAEMADSPEIKGLEAMIQEIKSATRIKA